MNKNSGLKRTPLYECHVNLGAKMAPFAGWKMPVQYAGIIQEHHAVRTAAGLFDVSHMGEIWLEGEGAFHTVQKLCTNDAGRLNNYQVMYSPMCYRNGGIVDDILVYRFTGQRFLLVVNACNFEEDLEWIKEHACAGTTVSDCTEDTALLALQGPLSAEILQNYVDINLEELKYFRFAEAIINGRDMIISRTGYTGEDGLEIFVNRDHAEELWNALLGGDKGIQVQPAGLGARDLLRFEACLPLYDHELTADITPLEAGLHKFVRLDKDYFIGKEALREQYRQGPPRLLVGFEINGRGIPRHGYLIYNKDGEETGHVTSGGLSPVLQKYLGLGLIKSKDAVLDNCITVNIRGKRIAATIVETPFYKKNK